MNTDQIVKDFVGFIDGFEARNLQSINQSVALQLNVMQTSLRIICNIANKKPELINLEKDLLIIEAALNNPNPDIVSLLVKNGLQFSEILLNHQAEIIKEKEIIKYIGLFIKSNIEAAESCKDSQVIETVIQLGDRFKDLVTKSSQ